MAIAKHGSTPNPARGPELETAGSAPADKTIRYCGNCLAVYRTDFECCPHDGGELLLSTTDPLLGETIGETYVIEALIGEGAMGRVYRARHRTLDNQRYAVKVLIGELAASSTMRMRFAREANNAARLDHPNVVNVIDYGKTPNGLHYLVMDLVEGRSLATILQEGPMAADRVIRIAHQLCEGLEHAHGRGVIHRDFKSDNILIVNSNGRELARIADFGLAMSTADDVRLTTTGVACTPAYAAPEQLRGRAFDHRVDLYGLGATLFEMLSGGYLPFEGNIEQTVSAKLSHDAPSVVTRAPNVPPGLVTIVSRLLSYDPDHRPRSARAVIKALETSLTLPRPPIRTIDMRPLRKPARSRVKGAIVGVTIMALALVVGNDDRSVSASMPVAEAASASPIPNIAVTATVVAVEPAHAPVAADPAPAAVPVTIKLKRFDKRYDKQPRRRVVAKRKARSEPQPRPQAEAPVVERAPSEPPTPTVTPATYETPAPTEATTEPTIDQ